MRSAAQVAEDDIALWNETDPERREALLAATWTTDATYVDPIMKCAGHAAIAALAAGVHSKFPGFRFSLDRPAEGHGHNVRFTWALGPAGADPVIKGTDFVTRSGDLIASVVGCLDLVSAGA